VARPGSHPVGSGQPAPAAQLGHDRQTQLFKLVRIWGRKPSQLKKGATEPPSGSAVFLQKKREIGKKQINSSSCDSEDG